MLIHSYNQDIRVCTLVIALHRKIAKDAKGKKNVGSLRAEEKKNSFVLSSLSHAYDYVNIRVYARDSMSTLSDRAKFRYGAPECNRVGR